MFIMQKPMVSMVHGYITVVSGSGVNKLKNAIFVIVWISGTGKSLNAVDSSLIHYHLVNKIYLMDRIVVKPDSSFSRSTISTSKFWPIPTRSLVKGSKIKMFCYLKWGLITSYRILKFVMIV